MDSERRRSPAEARRFWELAIDLWSSSGLNVADFCGREGLKESSFYGWQRRLRQEGCPSEIMAAPTAVEPPPSQPMATPIAQQPCRGRKRLRPSSGAGSLVPVRLVEDAEPIVASETSPSRPAPPVEIILPCGVRIRVEHGCQSALLQRVLAALEGRPC